MQYREEFEGRDATHVFLHDRPKLASICQNLIVSNVIVDRTKVAPIINFFPADSQLRAQGLPGAVGLCGWTGPGLRLRRRAVIGSLGVPPRPLNPPAGQQAESINSESGGLGRGTASGTLALRVAAEPALARATDHHDSGARRSPR